MSSQHSVEQYLDTQMLTNESKNQTGRHWAHIISVVMVRRMISVSAVLCQASALQVPVPTTLLFLFEFGLASTLTLNDNPSNMSYMNYAATASKLSCMSQVASNSYVSNWCTETCNSCACRCTRAACFDTPSRIPRRMHKFRTFLP